VTISDLIRKRETGESANANPAKVANDAQASGPPLAGLAHLALANSQEVQTTNAQDIRIAKVLAMLEDHQEARYALATDLHASPDGVTLTIAIRGVAAFEMLVPTESYDAFRLLELVQSLDQPSSIH
jgi:hypothetical protein